MSNNGSNGNAQSVSVEIYDQTYNLRGTDPDHIERLAQMVDSKMRAVAAHGATVDSLRVAVLASLNIADELLTLRARYAALSDVAAAPPVDPIATLRSRADSLSSLLDEALQVRKAG